MPLAIRLGIFLGLETVVAAIAPSFLQLEDAFYVLLEDGFKIVLEV